MLEHWYLFPISICLLHIFPSFTLASSYLEQWDVSWRHQIDTSHFLSQSASLYLWVGKLGLLIFRLLKICIDSGHLVDFCTISCFHNPHLFNYCSKIAPFPWSLFIVNILLFKWRPSSMFCKAGLVVINWPAFIMKYFSTEVTTVLLDIVIWVYSFDLSMPFWILKLPLRNQMWLRWAFFIRGWVFLTVPNTLFPVWWVVFK